MGGVSMALDISKIVDWLLGAAVAFICLWLLWTVLGSMSSEDIFIFVIWLLGTAIIFICLCLFWMVLRCLR